MLFLAGVSVLALPSTSDFSERITPRGWEIHVGGGLTV
jgi:hypothetical protein